MLGEGGLDKHCPHLPWLLVCVVFSLFVFVFFICLFVFFLFPFFPICLKQRKLSIFCWHCSIGCFLALCGKSDRLPYSEPCFVMCHVRLGYQCHVVLWDSFQSFAILIVLLVKICSFRFTMCPHNLHILVFRI